MAKRKEDSAQQTKDWATRTPQTTSLLLNEIPLVDPQINYYYHRICELVTFIRVLGTFSWAYISYISIIKYLPCYVSFLSNVNNDVHKQHQNKNKLIKDEMINIYSHNKEIY